MTDSASVAAIAPDAAPAAVSAAPAPTAAVAAPAAGKRSIDRQVASSRIAKFLTTWKAGGKSWGADKDSTSVDAIFFTGASEVCCCLFEFLSISFLLGFVGRIQ